jgi:hypothetical protein
VKLFTKALELSAEERRGESGNGVKSFARRTLERVQADVTADLSRFCRESIDGLNYSVMRSRMLSRDGKNPGHKLRHQLSGA